MATDEDEDEDDEDDDDAGCPARREGSPAGLNRPPSWPVLAGLPSGSWPDFCLLAVAVVPVAVGPSESTLIGSASLGIKTECACAMLEAVVVIGGVALAGEGEAA